MELLDAYRTTATGPRRDHAVVRDASVAKRLDMLADAAMAYRSAEQLYNDKRQATGYVSQGPLSFGEYEVGRSSMPKHCYATSQFKDLTRREKIFAHPEGFTPVQIGDPGHYDPYKGGAHAYSHATLAARAANTHNQKYRPFGGLETRELKLSRSSLV